MKVYDHKCTDDRCQHLAESANMSGEVCDVCGAPMRRLFTSTPLYHPSRVEKPIPRLVKKNQERAERKACIDRGEKP